MKRNEILIHAAMWMNLKVIILSERNHTKDYILLNPEKKHRMVVDRGLEGEGIGRNCLMDRYCTLE